MTCKEFQARLSELIDNELPAGQEKEMYDHAARCPACDQLLRQTMQLVAGLNELPDSLPVPLAAQAAWRRAVRNEPVAPPHRGIERFSRAVAGVAAALLVLCGATWMTRLQPGAPADVPAAGYSLVEAGDEVQPLSESAQGSYGVTGAQQRVYGRMSDGALKKEEDATPPPEVAASPTGAPERTLRLARSAQLKIETQDFAADCRTLENIVSGSEGYFELREEQEASLLATVRVPAEGLDDFLSQMEMVGRMVRRVEQARDLSADYLDIEERLQISQEKLAKLYELERNCQDVNDLVMIAGSISEELAESERLQGSENELRTQTVYASVEIELAEQVAQQEGAQEAGEMSVGARIESGFAQSVDWLKSFCVDAFVLLVSSLPRLVVALPALALVILLIVWIAKKRRR